MRTRLITYLTVVAVASPWVASAQTGHSAAAPRVRALSHGALQPPRERPRQARDHADVREEQTEKTTRTLRIGGTGELVVSNLSGDITVSRGGGSDVQIEVTKAARARTADEARELLPLVRVEFITHGQRAEVKAVYPRGEQLQPHQRRNMNVSVAFNIIAPAGARITARSLSGSIRITDIRGELSAVSTSGNIAIHNAERVATAKSSSGNVEVISTTSEIPLEANSLSGNIVVRQVKAPRLQLGSISGRVIIEDVESARIDAQSLSGDVEFSSPFAKGGRYDLNSHSGNIRVTVIGGTGFEVDANTFSGRLQADPSLNLAKQDEPQNGRRAQRALRAVSGDGSALLDITTFSGNVVITRK